jgi:uncharacterized protein YcfJ
MIQWMIAGAVIGAIIGAAIGAQFFEEVGTIVCAVAGGLVGVNVGLGFAPRGSNPNIDPNQNIQNDEKGDIEK